MALGLVCSNSLIVLTQMHEESIKVFDSNLDIDLLPPVMQSGTCAMKILAEA